MTNPDKTVTRQQHDDWGFNALCIWEYMVTKNIRQDDTYPEYILDYGVNSTRGRVLELGREAEEAWEVLSTAATRSSSAVLHYFETASFDLGFIPMWVDLFVDTETLKVRPFDASILHAHLVLTEEI
jgi:hypothetical protein